MIVFDDLTWAGGWVLDDLDEPAVAVYSQQGDASITLVPNATVEYDGILIYDQDVEIELELYADAAQEYVLPPAAPAYLQTGNVQVILFAGAEQEHIGVAAGEFGQVGNALLVLTSNAYQQHIEGSLPGDHFQQADAAITLVGGSAAQVWDPVATIAIGSFTVAGVAPFAAETPTEATLQLQSTPEAVSQVRLSLTQGSSDWINGVGPLGGAIRCEVRILHDGEWIPLVSLSHARPSALFYSGARFDALRNALIEGPVTVRLGGFEALGEYTAPRSLPGSTTLLAEAIT